MKRRQNGGGRKTFICPCTQQVSFSWMLRYQPLDISLITMYKSPHSLTAENRLFWKREKKEKREKEKTELTNVCAWQGADISGFSVAFVFKRQSTVKTKQNGHVVSYVFLSFIFLSFYIATKMCEFWSHSLLERKMVRQREMDKWLVTWHRTGGGARWQLLKLPAEWTPYTHESALVASEFCHKTKHAHCKNEQTTMTKKHRTSIRDMPRIYMSTGAAAKIQTEEKCLLSLGRYKQTFFWWQTQFTLLMTKGCRLVEHIKRRQI